MNAAAPVSGLPAPAAPTSLSEAKKKLHEVAHAFESILMGMLFKSMRETVGQNDLFSGGKGEEIFTGMMDQELAGRVSGGDRGIAGMIINRYSKHLENHFRAEKGSPDSTFDRQA